MRSVVLTARAVAALCAVGRAAALLVALAGAAPLPAQVSAGEYEVKAAYLRNFTQYVEWPATAFAAPEEPFTVCVLGRDPFGATLDATLAEHRSHDRPLAVARLRDADEAERCHLVFVSRREAGRQRAFLVRLAGLPVLTVGETDDFLADGGGIALVIVEHTVRFEVNLEAAQKAGLKVSSRMLSLARRVLPPPLERQD